MGVNEFTDAQTYKENDIDSDGDGKVDNADKLDGTELADIGGGYWEKDGDWDVTSTLTYTLNNPSDHVMLIFKDVEARIQGIRVNSDAGNNYTMFHPDGTQTSGADEFNFSSANADKMSGFMRFDADSQLSMIGNVVTSSGTILDPANGVNTNVSGQITEVSGRYQTSSTGVIEVYRH